MTHSSPTPNPTSPHSVRLVAITPEAESLIAYCARVSNPQNQDNPDSERLLRYCIKHQHWSIFEMANMVLEINTTRAIAAQILRHKSFSFQEFSQRYASVIEPPSLPSFRRQDTENRQNSFDDLEKEVKAHAQQIAANALLNSYAAYRELLDLGVAKECARDVLPLATPTRLYMQGSIRSWIHYILLRRGNGTQAEHRCIALQAQQIFQEQLPTVGRAAFVWE